MLSRQKILRPFGENDHMIVSQQQPKIHFVTTTVRTLVLLEVFLGEVFPFRPYQQKMTAALYYCYYYSYGAKMPLSFELTLCCRINSAVVAKDL